MLNNQRISVSIPPDEEGFIGRECPNFQCKSYFKVKPGTGLSGPNLKMHCPYCGHIADPSEFFTQDQIEYAKSIALRSIELGVGTMLKKWGHQIERSSRGGLISFKLKIKENLRPIQYYREKALETHVSCSECSLDYAIFGIFAFCPDCGIHNSIDIFNKNMELTAKEVYLTEEIDDPELKNRIIEDALNNTVAAFDGYGRTLCNAIRSKAKTPAKIEKCSFQNIQNANNLLVEQFGFDMASRIPAGDWDAIVVYFQKRHLLAHKFGIVDQEYIDKTQDNSAKIGTRVLITKNEVEVFIKNISNLGKELSDFAK